MSRTTKAARTRLRICENLIRLRIAGTVGGTASCASRLCYLGLSGRAKLPLLILNWRNIAISLIEHSHAIKTHTNRVSETNAEPTRGGGCTDSTPCIDWRAFTGRRSNVRPTAHKKSGGTALRVAEA